jgi:hypothetical protein
MPRYRTAHMLAMPTAVHVQRARERRPLRLVTRHPHAPAPVRTYPAPVSRILELDELTGSAAGLARDAVAAGARVRATEHRGIRPVEERAREYYDDEVTGKTRYRYVTTTVVREVVLVIVWAITTDGHRIRATWLDGKADGALVDGALTTNTDARRSVA